MPPTGFERRDPSDLRNRSVRLIERFFSNDSERERRAFFLQSFGEVSPNPCQNVEFSGSVATIAAAANSRPSREVGLKPSAD